MALLALTSPLAPVVAAVEGLRLQYPDLVRCVAPGLMTGGGDGWRPGADRCALAVLLVAGWTRARRVPLPVEGETFLNQAGQLGIRRARVAVLCDDPVAGAPGVVVAATREDLFAIVLEHAVDAGPELRATMHRLTATRTPAGC
ncbi:hypothetical protein OHA72_19015 [Dactylosporangium sp. NBC_01737]|uniref:hypothetical protein n=1 Tax=Dactylosporangium sp. NBC_01737 TaxID=2975959 RepID=UPI002E0E6478|nr:hypothetical protein OHA72_19015 [Dactylosporangium sp. NBC_01737]